MRRKNDLIIKKFAHFIAWTSFVYTHKTRVFIAGRGMPFILAILKHADFPAVPGSVEAIISITRM